MQKQFLTTSFLLLVLGGFGALVTDANAGATDLLPKPGLSSERVAARIADRLPNVHLTRKKLDDSVATNAVMLFVKSFDYDHSFFLDSDIKEFQAIATQLDDKLIKGDTTFAHTVFDRYKERAFDRTDYVNELLDKGFDLTVEEEYRWKRDKLPWPADKAAWNELWRKKIKNEYVARVAALESEPEATNTAAEVSTDHEVDGTNVVADVELDQDEALLPDEFVRERYKQFRLLIDTNFDEETILQRYLSSFARTYDPHSDYLSPRGVEDFDIHMSLSLVGIGARLSTKDGAAKIESIMKGGPAEADGRLKAGDKIVAVAQGDEEDVSILFWPLSKSVQLIRGEIGTKVVLTVIPAEDSTGTRHKKIDLIRAEVKLEESAAKGEIHEVETDSGTLRIGQLILPEFYADFKASKDGEEDARRCSVDVLNILNDFSTNDVDGVILDLRNDGGGSLGEAIQIGGFFIPLGPIVQVREPYGISIERDRDPATRYRGPLICMVNRLSASASEIVAAQLQDYGRAVIVGDQKTHGKGSVQSVFPLARYSDDLGSIKVTIANFYRIAGGSTQLRGVTPDVILPSLLDPLELGEEYLPNALPWTRVKPAAFAPWLPSVKSMIPELQKRSAERIATSEEMKNLIVRRDRIAERMSKPTVSLALEDRIAEILAEKEIDDLQKGPLASNDEEDKNDPILNETLQIFSDMIELGSIDDY